ncbi:hypothetical protein [Sorangium sp. So ce854]|uniref:hypothetical protein n=1 Tax=Sorangium sp. So ce854 TaxID=3133322 RepID=UPI003F610890
MVFLDPSGKRSVWLAEAVAQRGTLALDVYPSDPRGNDARFEGPEVVAHIEPAALPAQQPRARPKLVQPTRQALFQAPQQKAQRAR